MSSILQLHDYRSLIDLQPRPYKRTEKSLDYYGCIKILTEYFQHFASLHRNPTIEEQRFFIRSCLTKRTLSGNFDLPQNIYELIDDLLLYERDHLKSLTVAESLPIQFPSFPHLRVWRGDITTLIVDAIVNAGNSQLLGCFQPSHLCIDNVIHAAAGPRLRNDCYTIMAHQNGLEPVGRAKVTIGHNLPSKYVLHTVGPQIFDLKNVSSDDIRSLASCYESCLNLATEMKTIKSIAFCCISTGLFSFPSDQACMIAVQTVIHWFEQHRSQTNISLIIFNIFQSHDEQLYLSTFHNMVKSLGKM